MSTPNNTPSFNADIPSPNVLFIDSTGRVNPVWWRFLLQLFRRTGDQSGGDGQITIGDILSLESNIPLPVDISAQVAELSIGLQQAFAAIAAIQQSIPGFGEAFAQASVQAVVPDVMGMSTAQGAQAAEPVFATAAGASSLSEMTFARV
ncbi:hypothetical protein [Burkholderia gladioli]|uniref:hypothetical protein n=1 Tax=Burkholderia gladioli TaxID=28095 RepID=UPI00163F05E1|nr:hypothetical protein [Burkholderia gladioli]